VCRGKNDAYLLDLAASEWQKAYVEISAVLQNDQSNLYQSRKSVSKHDVSQYPGKPPVEIRRKSYLEETSRAKP